MIKGTVALPVWRSKNIAWLCMESLRNQKVDFEWELLVFEEKHPEQLGREFFEDYQIPGCTIRYLTYSKWISLSEKWAIMGMACQGNWMCLCAADNYYHPYMLQDAQINIAYCEWFITTKGYFYNINLKKMILYNAPRETMGLQMTASKRVISGLPLERKKRYIDNWVFKNLKATMYRDQSDHWGGTLCTNGMNNISHKRHKYFKDIQYPFEQTETSLCDVVPIYIADKLITL
ncbi:MAG TPA: hypothetical protein ENH85_02125 [Candidatus Scalindua sp.]|nr:hypothetical protein [Candidatus Scalindua sp.]